MTTPEGAARTAIVTVDDDAGVSRAVARDLRRRYGEQHRIVRAESGDAALEALREMRLRGDEVAVIVADYRMPGMNGIEFLERAMDLYPAARRVLLTAYADTGAAIDAINVVDLDHYLLKPWDPPEEKLYPVVDELLSKWHEEDRHPVHVTKVVGHRWSARSSEVREFLARNQVAYRWYESEGPDGQRLMEAAGADGVRLPVVITPDGDALVEPTDAELASCVGLATAPAKDFYDLIVIGGGPAGLGAAVYGASEGLRTVLVERTATGGQAGQSSRIENYLGFPAGISGTELTTRAVTQARKFGARMATPYRAVALEPGADRHVIRLEGDVEIAARAIVLATGADYRRLPVEDLEAYEGISVFYAAGPPEAQRCSARRVAVVGGGNSAAQAAIWLSRGGALVTLLHRRRDLRETMSDYLIGDLERYGVAVRDRAEIAELHGVDGQLEAVTLRDGERVPLSYLFLFLGASPCTEWLGSTVLRDENGFILTGAEAGAGGALETSVPGIYAAGDVRSASLKRCATAVGEGATVVRLVHERLAPARA